MGHREHVTSTFSSQKKLDFTVAMNGSFRRPSSNKGTIRFRPSSAKEQPVRDAPVVAAWGRLVVARKRTLLSLTLCALQEAPSSGNHAQLGQYS